MDNETKTVLTEQDFIRQIVDHPGWKFVRSRLAEKILDLQNAFNIEERTATTMLRDLQARKLSSTILFDFLREIEGTSSQAVDNKELKGQKSHVVVLPE